jgi:hypothetical protein
MIMIYVPITAPTAYSTETAKTLGLPRTLLLIVAGVVSSNLVIMVRALRHEFRTPHILELLVKVVLSVALDYAFNNRTSRNTWRATRWDEFAL